MSARCLALSVQRAVGFWSFFIEKQAEITANETKNVKLQARQLNNDLKIAIKAADPDDNSLQVDLHQRPISLCRCGI